VKQLNDTLGQRADAGPDLRDKLADRGARAQPMSPSSSALHARRHRALDPLARDRKIQLDS
jgi:hypothetical protein